MDEASAREFWGEYEHSVDDKGRVVIPQDFREALGDRFIVTRGPDKSIWVFPTRRWQPIQDKLRDFSLNGEVAFLQKMLGGRTEVSLDPQARLAIPKHLRQHSGINDGETAVIVGQGEKFDIWTRSAWEAYCARFTSENVYAAAQAAGIG